MSSIAGIIFSKVAFTLGNPNSYEVAIDKHPDITKLGRTGDYDGGCVFRTAKDAADSSLAEKYGYRVYGLILPNGWNQDVDISKEAEERFCRLINDARIVRIQGPAK